MADLGDRIAALSPEKRELLLKKLGHKHEPTSEIHIRPRPAGSDRVPLSFAQQRLWFLDQLDPGNTSYNNHAILRIRGPLDETALGRSIDEIVRRHEMLRTRFDSEDEQPVQIVDPAEHFELPVVDLRQLATSEAEAEIIRRGEAAITQPFDLACGPLLRLELLKLGEQEHVLLLVMHHIVSDGFFIAVFGRELATLHGAFRAGEPSPLPELEIQYADYALWQREWLRGDRLEGHLSYWRQQLEGLPVLQLATDHARPAELTFPGARETLAIPADLMGTLSALSQREGVTLFMTLLAAFQALLGRYTGQDDIVVGSPIANRTVAEVEGLIGFFVNSLTLRSDLSGDPDFRSLLGRVREVALGAFAHQEVPFEKLVEELRPDRDRSRSPLFQVMFALQNLPLNAFELSGLHFGLESLAVTTARFELEMHLWQTEDGTLRASLVYNTDLFERASVARMLEHYRTLLAGIAADPSQRLSELPLLSDPERAQLAAWNDTRTEARPAACVHEQFEAQARQSPDAVAVRCGDQQFSYGEIRRRAALLAGELARRGVGPEVRVALCMERSPELVVGALAVLEAGGAYVPLDPGSPKERLAFMLADSGASVLLTHESLQGKLPVSEASVLCLDLAVDWETIWPSRAGGPPSGRANPANLAYVIYTSGSTGVPKAVCIPHQSLANLVTWHREAFSIVSSDRTTQLAGTAFDASVWELWPTLTAGASLVIAEADALASPSLLRDWLVSNAITTSFVPTPLAEPMLALEWPADTTLRTLLTGGDKLHRNPPRSLPFELVNNYGPTENTVVAASGLVPAADETDVAPAIGRPITNVALFLLDDRLNPVPIGAPGELCIGGESLARGYLGKAAATAEKFVPSPFGQAGTRLYRSGDRARFLPDGRIEFLGRIDHQVKIRGYRIELGEIETLLAQHPAVSEAAVLAREDEPGSARLVAYVVGESEAASAALLREVLRRKLPEYMVPAAFVFLEALPLNRNGKLDRAALPAPEGHRPDVAEQFVAPRTHLEEVLAGIWCELLGIDRVGVHDNFFDLGGHSLLATRVVSQLRDAVQVDLPLRVFFRAPTVEGMTTGLLEDATQRERIETTAKLYLQVAAMSDGDVERLLAEETRESGE